MAVVVVVVAVMVMNRMKTDAAEHAAKGRDEVDATMELAAMNASGGDDGGCGGGDGEGETRCCCCCRHCYYCFRDGGGGDASGREEATSVASVVEAAAVAATVVDVDVDDDDELGVSNMRDVPDYEDSSPTADCDAVASSGIVDEGNAEMHAVMQHATETRAST